jgi:hypothetical protein
MTARKKSNPEPMIPAPRALVSHNDPGGYTENRLQTRDGDVSMPDVLTAIANGPDADVIDRAAALPDPYVDLPYRRSHRQLTDETADIVRHTEAAKTVALVSDKSSQFGAKHVRALELYQSARNDLRDLRIAEHEIVRKRDEAIAICCERKVGTEDTSQPKYKTTNEHPMHTKTSVTEWAYQHDPDVKEAQSQRDDISVSIFHAEAAVDIAERAVTASGLLLSRDTTAMQADIARSLAGAITALPDKMYTMLEQLVTGDLLSVLQRAAKQR